MLGSLEEKIKNYADKIVFAGKLTLVALAITYGLEVGASLIKAHLLAPRDLYVNYAVDSSKNDQIGDLLDIRLTWDSLVANPGNGSTLEILRRVSVLVDYFVDYEENDSSSKIKHLLGNNLSICQKYAFLTYAGFVDLTERHPELSHHLENVRIVTGNISDGRIEGLHAWLEVKVGDEWQNYETANLSDGFEYYPWVSFRKLENGSLERDVNYYNIFMHEGDGAKGIFRDLEDKLDREILSRPFTNLVDDFVIVPILASVGYRISGLIKEIPETKHQRKG